MANADVQGMLVRIEATTQQLRQELELAYRAVASTSSKIDKSLAAVDAAFDRVNASISQSSGRALDSLSSSVQQAQSRLGLLDRSLGDIGTAAKGMGGAVSAQSRALDDLIARIDPAAGAMRRLNEQQAALGRFANSGMLDSAQYASLTASIEAQRKALTGSGQAMHLAGISAGQYTAAMRMLPMQITDVVTSLAGGMPVWMVAIQQGGQIRDMFGGIGNAATAMIGALNPTMLALAAIGAAIAVLTAAYKGVEEEQKAYSQALILSGGAAGATADQVRMLSARMDEMSGVTQRQAAAALGEIAKGGKFAASQLEGIGIAAVAMENATGKAVSDTVKEFTSLAEEPAKASAKLNEQYNYLTVSVYRQIAALEEQGKISEASKLATDAYAVALQQRAVDIEGSLGTLETAWKSIGDIASEAWDAMLNIGRPDTLEQQLDQVERKIKQRREDIYAGSLFDFGPTEDDLRREKTQLELSIQQRDTEAQWRAEQAAANKAAISVEQELARQQDQLEKLKGNGSHEQEAIRWIEAHAAATQEDKDRVIARGKALDEQEAANKREAASTKSATSEAKKHAEALKDYLGKAAVATSAADAMAGAYFAGADSVRELTLQQKIEQELLKTGAGARDEVTAAVRRQQDALDRLDIGKRYADLKLDTDQLHAQAAATLAGTDALQAFNVQKAMAAALAGKDATALSAESQQLLEQIKLNQEAAKQVEMANRANSIMDRLYPQQKLLREYTEDQKALWEAMAIDKEHADQYRAALERLGAEYEANKKAGTAWGQWTASALERVDSAFADAWKNIGGGFASFRTSLTDAFRQMLAELAHMAITKPIVLSIGAALGIGGSQQALANGGSGIWGMLGSAGSGSGLFGSVWSGLKSGGLSGALSGAGTWGSGMLSSLDSGAGQLFGSLTGSSSLTHAPLSYQLSNSSLGNLSSSLGYVGTGLAAVGSAMAIYNSYQQQGFKGALVTGGATALGAVFGGPIGAALGAAVGNFVSGKLFGSGWHTTDTGIAVRARDGEFQGWNYQHQEKSGGWLSSSGSKYSYSAMDAELKDQLSKRFDSVVAGVPPLFEKLGFGVANGALDGLNVGMRNIALSGSAAQQQKQLEKGITAWLGQVGNVASADIGKTLIAEMASKIQGAAEGEIQAIADSYGLGSVDASSLTGLSGKRLSKALENITGFGKNAYQTLTDLVGTLDSVNTTFETLDLTLYDGSLAGARMAENMVTLAGGMDAFQQATATYYDKFFSDTEKAQDSVQAVIRQFAASDVVLPATREQYRALVESIDTSTESGRQLVNTLMQLAGAADTAYTAFDSIKSAGDAAVSAAQQSVVSAYQSESSALQATINKFDQFAASLGDFRDQLSQTIVGASSAGDQLDTLRRQFADTAALARLGNEQALSDLPGIGSSLANAAQSYSSSREDYIRELARISQASADAQDTASRQSSIAQQQLDAMTAQLDALGLINDSVQSLGDALAALADVQAGARSDQIDYIAGMIAKGFDALQPTQVVSALGVGFDVLDANTNGLLTQTELSDALKGKASDAQIQSLQYVVDSNFDGLISATELNAAAGMTQAQALTAGLAGIQQAIGSAITLAQAQSGLGGIASGSSIANQFGVLDTNKDGTLSQAEINGTAPAQQSVTYGRLDALKAAAALGISTAGGSTAAGLKRIAEEMAAATGNQVTINSPTLGKVSAFAAGGYHSGGLRLVGENGPELEVTGPSRIFNARQTASLLSGGGASAEEIRGLRADMAQVFDALRAIAKHTMQTAKRTEFLERWDYDGMPTVRA